MKPITLMATANIMIVVATLEIYIDRKAEAIMKPRTIRLGVVPMRWTMLMAMHRCSPTCSSPPARMKPPRKSRISGSDQEGATSSIGRRPASGITGSGRSEVIGIGTASLSHQITI